MTAVDVELIAQWAARVLENDRSQPFLRDLSPERRSALGSGFSAIRAAVLGEDLTLFEQQLDDRDLPGLIAEPDPVAVALHGYLVGIAAGIAATGADQEPTSLVAGLVTAAAQLRFSWPEAARFGAVDTADRIGLTAADMSGEGADLVQVVSAIDDALHAAILARAHPDTNPGAQQDHTAQDMEADLDHGLSCLIQGVLGALYDVVVPTNPWNSQPKFCGGCAPRRFLAELTFTIDGSSSIHLRIVEMLHAHGTAIVCTPSSVENVRDYHLHTVHPGVVISEAYAIATPFDLTIMSTEPSLDGTMP